MKKELTPIQQKAEKDLNIIVLATMLPLIIYIIYGSEIMNFVKTSDMNLWIKAIPVMLIQFGLAGLGSLLVIFFRKEKFKEYGLVKDKTIITILLSALACVPAFIFLWVNHEIDPYLPFQGCFLTKRFLAAEFPSNVLGYLMIAMIWGFCEGFNYAVISQKINDRYPSKNQWLNYGAIVSGILCVLIHGMIGLDMYTILEAITSFIIIYGMLLVKDKTNNAWGCIFVFVFFWNAI